MTGRKKGERFDALVIDATFQLDFWTKWRRDLPKLASLNRNAGFAEGQIHAWGKILWYADHTFECPCDMCSDNRLQKTAERCEKTGDRHV